MDKMDKYSLKEEQDQNENRTSIVEQFTPHPDYKEEPKDRCSAKIKCLISAIVFFIVGLVLGITIGYVVLMFTNEQKPTTATQLTETTSVKVPVTEKKCQNTTVIKTVTKEVIQKIPCKTCAVVNPEVGTPWSKKTLFAPLSKIEMATVYKYLLQNNIVDTVTEQNKLRLKFNYVTSMSLSPSSKTDAIKYLDENGKFPGRYAIARVVHGTHTPPYVAEYKVGPIDASNVGSMTSVQVRSVSFDKRPRDSREYTLLYFFALREFKKLNPILDESFDGATLNTVSRLYIEPASRELHHERESHVFVGLLNGLDALDILPVSAVISHRSTNLSEWNVYDFYYANQGPYRSAEELLAAYNSTEFDKIVFPTGYRQKLHRSFMRNESKPYRQKANVSPPRTYEPEGSRYTLDGHRVDWMGWSLEVNTHEIRGPGIFDVKYKGERIVYENSLNELTMVYSSGTTGAGLTATVISDILSGLGRKLGFIHGIDCPDRARYLPSTHWDEGTQAAAQFDAVCIFEANSETPLWRHKQSKSGGINDNHLVLRVAMNTGNYDYFVDFRFFLDGSMKTSVSATGSIFASFWNPASNPETPFGFRVSDYSTGSIHDHSFAFKLDLDIAGRNNTFQEISWKYGEYKTVIKSEETNSTIPTKLPFKQTRYLDYVTMETEEGLIKDSRKPTLWTVVNRNSLNQWGAKRGYRIISTTDHSEVLPQDHPAMKSLSYMKYHCAVTKQKDSEHFASNSLYDLYGLSDPLQTLDDYIDGENITNTDIVTWITVQYLQTPTSEDVPMTSHIEQGFVLKPFNYFDSSETFDMPQYSKIGNQIKKPYSTEQCYESKQLL